MVTEKVNVEAPEYFRKFRCKCGDCRTVCCQGWRITLSEGEYTRLMQLQCSGELRGILNESFTVFDTPTEARYAFITATEGGKCRIMDREGWCSLHKECGESVQPAVCRLFPRSVKPGDVTEAVCSGACERVIEMLMETDGPLRFVTETLEVSAAPPDAGMDEEQRSRRRRCMEIWQEAGVPHTERLSRIGACIGEPYRADAAELYAHGLLLLRELGLHSGSLHALAERITAWEAPADAESRAKERLPGMERYLENILANHMYFVQFPYAGDGIPPTEAWDGLYGVYALLHAVAVHAACTGENPEIAFADGIAAALRCAEHTDFYHNAHIVLRGRRR